MRVLFVMQYPGYLRYYDSTVRLLGERGHAVHVAFENVGKQREGLEALRDAPEGIQVLGRLPRPSVPWTLAARDIRRVTDYLRYLDDRMPDAQYLRRRTGALMPSAYQLLRRLERRPRPRLLSALQRLLRVLEGALPSQKRLERFLREQQPDVVFVTPLVTDASRQPDLVRSAKALGIPTVHGVASWDHLTTKGVIRITADRVLVWNEIQRSEAEQMHGVPPERVVVTGAQPFDRWFTREPSTTRDEFCRKVGLPADRPFVLFVGSTESISIPGAEFDFVREWVRALRASDSPQLRDLAILVRPHPYNPGRWPDADLSDLGPVEVWPRGGANPVDEDDRAVYFDSMYHSASVVGINTSAMVETAIVGRPVFTVRSPEFADSQDGTIHFSYLLDENGGPVRVASSLEEHLVQLQQVLADPDEARARLQRFVESFVRPNGLDRPGTPIVADAIETTAGDGATERWRLPIHRYPLAALLYAYGAVRAVFDGRGHGKRLKRNARPVRMRLERAGKRAELGLSRLGSPGRLAGRLARRVLTALGVRLERRMLKLSKRLSSPDRARPGAERRRAQAPGTPSTKEKTLKKSREKEKVS